MTIREIEPSEGYLLNETVYNVGAEAKNYTVEHNPISVGVTEQIIKGEIEIIKHTDQGQTKIETPEEGATFQLFLKSAGSFDKARTVSVIPLSATKGIRKIKEAALWHLHRPSDLRLGRQTLC